MIRAIVMKEWRETRAFALLALAIYCLYVGNLTGRGGPVLRSIASIMPGAAARPPDVPFVEGNFATMLGFVGCVLAITLGFRQSAWEPHQGTILYLLHLPLPRRTIILTKLLTGIGLLLLCSLAPILAYAAWAATPRTHPGPFVWSMTGPAFRALAMMPLVYLGAFASGLRPARWFGTRLFPLAAVPLPAIATLAVPSWWLFGLPILALAAAFLVAAILQEAETRDY